MAPAETKLSIGLLGIATYLPPQTRHNDWWPRATVERWRATRGAPPPPAPGGLTPAMQRVLAAMAEQAVDPFQGVVERRVLPDGMASSDMELDAAQRAMARAGVDRREIDVLLTHTAVPEYLLSNTACILHHRLGLARTCFSMQAEASGHSFLMQLAIAEQMIATG